MDEPHSANLPPELEGLGKRMSAERPVASNFALDRAMTRAQNARARKPSLLWRSTAPRAPKVTVALGAAAILATAGMAGMGVLGGKTGTLDAALAQYCPGTTTVFVRGTAGTTEVEVAVQALFPGQTIQIISQTQVGDQVEVVVCIVL